MSDHTCPRCGGVRIYRKCVHGCDGKTPNDVRLERSARRRAKTHTHRETAAKEPHHG